MFLKHLEITIRFEINGNSNYESFEIERFHSSSLCTRLLNNSLWRLLYLRRPHITSTEPGP